MSSKREFKGKSLLEFPDNYVVIDIETTGLDPTVDEIIEISAIKLQDNNIVDKFSRLIKPTLSISDFISSLTGITSNMLTEKPTIENSLPEFIEFVGTSILVGHNVNFDINFIYDASMKYLDKPFSNDFIDTMRIAKILYPEMKHHRLSDLMELYNIEEDEQHRALPDCQITNNVFLKEKEVVLERYENIADFKKRPAKKYMRAADILASEDIEFDESHPLYGKLCVFTGTLEKMVRKNAMQCVVNCGGSVGDSVTKSTNYLILGNNDYCTTIKDGKSSKQKKAEALRLKGNDIEIISENVFYDMLEEN